MKALVLNLAAETERMAYMEAQLRALGLAFERLEAVTPATLTPPPDDRYWSLWKRPLRQTECAAFASHLAAWRRVAAGDQPWLILEDDAVLMPGVPDLLTAIEAIAEADHVSLETRGRRKLFSADPHPAAPIHRLWQDRTGAAAYVLRPSGANKLLRRAARAPALADAMLCAAYDLLSWQAVPALACQLDRCEAEGFTPPLRTESGIDKEPKPNAPPSAVQRLRRLSGEVRTALRLMRRKPGSRHAEVPLSRD